MFVVRTSTTQRVVEAWSATRLPFEPKGWKTDLRSQLQAALEQLVAGPGEILHARYTSAVDEPVDAENVLLYNVGASALRASARNGVRFERSFRGPPQSPDTTWRALHYHRYEIARPDERTFAWKEDPPLVSWSDVRLGRRLGAGPTAAWYALHKAIVAHDRLADPPRLWRPCWHYEPRNSTRRLPLAPASSTPTILLILVPAGLGRRGNYGRSLCFGLDAFIRKGVGVIGDAEDLLEVVP